MDIEARIRRRQRRGRKPQLVRDYESLSPVAHVDEPVDRGSVLEQLLDHLDPVFDGRLPPNGYVYGPAGSGKSAVVTALLGRLRRLSTEGRPVIHTSTRAETPTLPGFVAVDTRETTSEFTFYHHVLDRIVDERVPRQGVGTDAIRARLRKRLRGFQTGIVVGVDHVGEPNSLDAETLLDLFDRLPENVRWIAVGRPDPGETALAGRVEDSIRVDPYRPETLLDVLMSRASAGLAQRTLDHGLVERVADWAGGNAHDGLAALFGAVDYAVAAGRSRVTLSDLEEGMAAVPRPCVSLGRVLALAGNRKRVLRSLVDLDDEQRRSVDAATEAVATDPAVPLSPGTVKRFLYELAEIGVVERIPNEQSSEAHGRPPSRVELQFPVRVFRRLYDLERSENRRADDTGPDRDI